jgi:hypothetical protein
MPNGDPFAKRRRTIFRCGDEAGKAESEVEMTIAIARAFLMMGACGFILNTGLALGTQAHVLDERYVDGGPCYSACRNWLDAREDRPDNASVRRRHSDGEYRSVLHHGSHRLNAERRHERAARRAKLLAQRAARQRYASRSDRHAADYASPEVPVVAAKDTRDTVTVVLRTTADQAPMSQTTHILNGPASDRSADSLITPERSESDPSGDRVAWLSQPAVANHEPPMSEPGPPKPPASMQHNDMNSGGSEADISTKDRAGSADLATPLPAPSVETTPAGPGPDVRSGKTATANATADVRIALVFTRSDIHDISDLESKSVAIDKKNAASTRSVRAALAVAGAGPVDLTDNGSKAVDRLIEGEVPAAVLAFITPAAASKFPAIAGFNIFKLPVVNGDQE